MSQLDPVHLILELARAEQAGDPHAFHFAPQDYLTRSEGGAFGNSRLDWSEALLSDLSAVRKPGRDPAVVQRLGETLRRFLAPTRWVRDEDRLLAAVKEQRRVLITIRSAAAELYALPWELLTIQSTGQHIGELPGVLLRYEWPDTHSIVGTRPAPQHGRILVAWSAAAGATPASEHISGIHKASQAGGHSFDSTKDVLANVSISRLSQALAAAAAEQRPIAILHLLCHGAAAGSTFGLALDSADAPGEIAVVDAGRLRQLLAPYASTLRLVVLSACDSGNDGGLGNQLGSVAQALHRGGFAAVVASRYPLSVAGSVRLTDSLYAGLLSSKKSLTEALLDVRLRLAEEASQLDWASLQFYARAEDDAPAATLPPPAPVAAVSAGPTVAPRPVSLWLAAIVAATLVLGGAGAYIWRTMHPTPAAAPTASSGAAVPAGGSLNIAENNDITGGKRTKVRLGVVHGGKVPQASASGGSTSIGSGNKIKVAEDSEVEAGIVNTKDARSK